MTSDDESPAKRPRSKEVKKHSKPDRSAKTGSLGEPEVPSPRPRPENPGRVSTRAQDAEHDEA
jgi:hypothetical protein